MAIAMMHRKSPSIMLKWIAWIITVDGFHNCNSVRWLAVNAKEPAALI